MRRSSASRSALLIAALCFSSAAVAKSEATKPSQISTVAQFHSVPVGVAASKNGRVFLAFSRAIDPSEPISVAELKNGKPQPFPRGFRQESGEPAPNRLLSVQAVTVDARDRLWILDTGKVGAEKVKAGTAKLIGVDLGSGKAVRTIQFPADIAGAESFLNDLRVDLSRGRDGVAFITDASPKGPNGIVVVDLGTGKATRRLNDDPSVKPDPTLTLTIHGQPLLQKQGPDAGKPFPVGADGIALSADRKFIYFSPLSSHHLFRVSADAIADPARSDEQVRKTVEDLGDKGFASDGMLADAENGIYATDLEQDAIRRRTPDGTWETIAQGPQLHWPDSMALKPDGTLLVTVTQIDLSPRFKGEDARQKPFALYAIRTDSRPLMLERATHPHARRGRR